ncbi:MAG: hypothetical protein AAFX79_05760 [Planctomycetota bacterium]
MSPIDPRELADRPAPRRQSRYCIKCNYDLAGLPDTTKCPECGTSNAFSPGDTRRGTGISRAPGAYVRQLGMSLWLAAIAMLLLMGTGTLGVLFLNPVTLGLQFLAAAFWLVAVWMATRPKPDRFQPGQRDAFDDERMRWTTLGTQATRLLAIGVAGIGLIPAVQGVAAVEWIEGLLSMVAALGFIALSFQLAALGDWMGDDDTGRRCRNAAWCIAVGGGGIVLTPLMVLVLPILGLLIFVFFLLQIIGNILLAISLVSLARGANWAVENAKQRSVVAGRRAARDRQLADEAQQRLDRSVQAMNAAEGRMHAGRPPTLPEGTPVPRSHVVDRPDDARPYDVAEDADAAEQR